MVALYRASDEPTRDAWARYAGRFDWACEMASSSVRAGEDAGRREKYTNRGKRVSDNFFDVEQKATVLPRRQGAKQKRPWNFHNLHNL